MSRSGSLEVSLRGTGRTRARGSLAPRSVSTAAHGPATALRARSSYLVAGRLVQDMGLVSTSYQVTPAGLEQSFTVSRPPSGPGGGLVIDLGPAGGWAVAADGSSLVEQGPAAPTSLVYGGLRTTDAQGAVLASQLRVAGGTVEIVVRGAGRGAYPVVIDPTWSSSSSPTATLTSSNSSPAFGYSVAMSADGTTALVGAPVANSFHGAAYVFNVSDEGSWANSSAATATLTNLGDAANDWFGSSVALSGDGTTALVGAFGVSSGTGAAYVFNVPSEASWTTSWTPTVTLTNGLSGGWFGLSVAMSFYGTTALIGARTGAYVFNVPNEASWASSSSPTATLAKPGGSTYDSSGYSVAMSADGTTALIGDADANAAYVFNVASEASWVSSSSTPTATLANSGASGGDLFGYSAALSADGTTALIGAGGASSGTGAAYVFNVASEASWASSSAPTATLANSAGSSGDHFGLSVALSSDGTTALIGAGGDSPGTEAAYVFHVASQGSWATSSAPTATLVNPDGCCGDGFFAAVALSADGTTAVFGGYGGSSWTDAASVFQASSERPWTSSAPTATLSNPGQELFGISVALSADGTTALVGAWAASLDMGAAYVFHVTSEGSWVTSSMPTATLTYSAGSYEDDFGTSVALSADGTTALIGAPGAGYKGAAYVFHVASEGSWAEWSSTPTATLADTAGSNRDEFGGRVALSADGTTALIGAAGVSSGTGAAYVFHVASEGSWASSSTPTATLTGPDGAADDYFGGSVALSADGTTALIGAYGVSSSTGAAYVFHVASEGPWASSSTPTATLTNSAGSDGDSFGYSVAMSSDGTTALIGSPGVSSSTGAAYVFHVSDEGPWASSSTPTAILSNSAGSDGDLFGISAALSADGTTALIGAFGVSSWTGASYVFQASTEGPWATSSAPTATLANSAGSDGDGFGDSVALSSDGAAALVGACYVSSWRGAAYVYATTSTPPVTTTTTIVPTTTTTTTVPTTTVPSTTAPTDHHRAHDHHRAQHYGTDDVACTNAARTTGADGRWGGCHPRGCRVLGAQRGRQAERPRQCGGLRLRERCRPRRPRRGGQLDQHGPGLLAGQLRRWGVQLRRRPFLRLGGRAGPRPEGGRHRPDRRQQRVLAGRGQG